MSADLNRTVSPSVLGKGEAGEMRVLIIEDDERIAQPLREGLGRYGFTTDHAPTGAAALSADPADMILLDLGLPDIDGIDLCQRLRRTGDTPIIMITARDTESDRVVGLELGADDYLAKPFGLRELVARIRAVSRRCGPAPAAEPEHDVRRFGPMTIDLRTRRVSVHGEPVNLAPKEFDLLGLLTADPGAVCTRRHILDTVWDPHFFGPTKTLDVHVAALRRKLGSPTWIETVRGVGFRFLAVEAGR
jgi:DNA-binding response OmpR family regulator